MPAGVEAPSSGAEATAAIDPSDPDWAQKFLPGLDAPTGADAQTKLCDDDPTMPYCGYNTSKWQDISALPEGTDPATCVGVAGQDTASDAWCVMNCGGEPPNCPAKLCKCGKAAEQQAQAQQAQAQ